MGAINQASESDSLHFNDTKSTTFHVRVAYGVDLFEYVLCNCGVQNLERSVRVGVCCYSFLVYGGGGRVQHHTKKNNTMNYMFPVAT